MKILIVGAKGMLGSDLVKAFEDLKPVCWNQNDLDITNEKLVFEKIGELKPDFVINAAAYTDVDGCETNRELAMKVNGEAVGYLASICQKIEAFFVHYSTDYVFRGDKAEGYKESDKAENPLNVYGQSKLLAEELLQKNCQKYYLIRTSWLFGRNGKNFVDTMLKLAKEKNEIKVVNDQHGKPSYTEDLAQRTKNLIVGEPPSGIYHITNEGETTWYDFACEIFRQVKDLGILAKVPKVIPCSSEEFLRPAKRPAYSILINTKLSLGRPWQEALEDYLGKFDI